VRLSIICLPIDKQSIALCVPPAEFLTYGRCTQTAGIICFVRAVS
jgi:hypothetical protein